jgi:hypothetical protein
MSSQDPAHLESFNTDLSCESFPSIYNGKPICSALADKKLWGMYPREKDSENDEEQRRGALLDLCFLI